MTPLHYCICSNQFTNSKVGSLTVLEALISPIRGGRGCFTSGDASPTPSVKPLASNKRIAAQTIEGRAFSMLSSVVWFQSESIYNSVTGQEVVALQADDSFSFFHNSSAASKSSTSSFSTLTRQQLSLSDLTSRSLAFPIDPNLYESSPSRNTSAPSPTAPPVDYEIIIPWLVRNVFKRASVMGDKLGASAVDILEELVELIDSNYTRTLIVPEIKDLLKSLGIMVTEDIIKELCNMYPGALETVQQKWDLINQSKYRHHQMVLREDDSDEEPEPESKSQMKSRASARKSSKQSSRFSSSKSFKESKETKSSSKESSSSKTTALMPELYDDGEEEMVAESKASDRDRHGRHSSHSQDVIRRSTPEEEYGLDFNSFVDDIATGRGMKSITTYASKTKPQTQPVPEPLPSNQEDLLLSSTETQSLLLSSFMTKLDLPQTLTISTILRYRKLALNAVDEYSSTPLLIASAMNKREMVDMLLSSGADMTISSSDGLTPLTVSTDHLIISSLQKKLMRLLLKKNPRSLSHSEGPHNTIGATNLLGQKTMREFGLTLTETPIPSPVEESNQLQLTRSCGNSQGLLLHLQQLHSKRWNFSKTPLSWAVEGGLDEIIDQLVSLGADVQAGDAMGRTPLHHCVALAGQISVSESSNLEEAIAAVLKLRSVAEVLLNGGAEVMARTVSGRTPLHELFCRGQDLNTTKKMTTHPPLERHQSSSSIALMRTKSLFVRSLLQWGGDPVALDRHGYGAIHYCARENMSSCLVEMLKATIAGPGPATVILSPCPRGRTILHLACLYGCEETAEVICKWDGDESEERGVLARQDSSGKVPRDLMAKDMNSLCLHTIWSAARSGNSLR
jgi:ankyrin repeat protein